MPSLIIMSVLVSELRSTVADDDSAIGSVADRCLLSGVKQKSNFKGVRTVFEQVAQGSKAGFTDTASSSAIVGMRTPLFQVPIGTYISPPHLLGCLPLSRAMEGP